MSAEKAEKLFSQEEKDEMSYYQWAIKHHLQLVEIWKEKLNKIENE